MTRRTPLWVRGRLDPDFDLDPRRACLTPTGRVNELYFDDTIEALAACQAICVRCPVFRDCTRWTLANYEDFPYGIFAGMTEDVRRRIHQSKEVYYDWRQEWNRRHLNERIAARKLRENYQAGERKRAQAKTEMPLCPFCHQQATVSRNGRQVNLVLSDRQRYHCRTCNRNFLGEEL